MSHGHVHPLFRGLLNSIMDTPCRVTAELNQHEAALNAAEQETFDVYNDDQMKSVIGERLYKPVQDLLCTLDQIHLFKNSFGLEKEKAFDALLPELKALRAAVKELWLEER